MEPAIGKSHGKGREYCKSFDCNMTGKDVDKSSKCYSNRNPFDKGERNRKL